MLLYDVASEITISNPIKKLLPCRPVTWTAAMCPTKKQMQSRQARYQANQFCFDQQIQTIALYRRF
jgi:hypothetical protein